VQQLPSRRIPGADSRAPIPALIEIGQLSAADQTLASNYLRQLSLRLDAQLIPTLSGDHDIRLCYRGDGLALEHKTCTVALSSPLRLPQLGEALSELLSGIVMSLRPSGTAESLQDLLLPNLRIAGPVRVRCAAIGSLLFDPLYRHAWSEVPRDDLVRALGTCAHIASVEQISVEEFSAALASKKLTAVSTEEICWVLDTRKVFAPHHAHWAARHDLRVRLVSWPNLSRDPDGEAWLKLLAKARQPVTIATLLESATRLCGSSEIARNKLVHLAIFRHLRLVPEAAKPHAPPPQALTPQARGMLARLRGRLREMIS